MTTFELVIATIIPALWVSWLLYWWLSARNVKATRSRESLAAELRHRAPLMLAALCTGILLAFLGMVVALGEVRGLVALAFAAIAFVVKSRAEEARMRATFPEYDSYAQQTSAIIPYVC